MPARLKTSPTTAKALSKIIAIKSSIYPQSYIVDSYVYYTHRLEFSAQAYKIVDFYIGQLNGEPDTLAEFRQRLDNGTL